MVVVFGPLGLRVAVIFSPSFSGKILRYLFDSDGRIFSLLIQVGSTKINIVNIYAPNVVSDRKIFFEGLHNDFISQGDLVIGGDFNCVDSTSDKLHFNAVFSSDTAALSALKSSFLLIDIWRKKNPRAISFTRCNGSNTQVSRLDRFFVSKSFLTKDYFCKSFPCVFSDHGFIDLVLELDGFSTRCSSVWKFNSSLLSDAEFKQLIVNEIEKRKLEVNNFDSLGGLVG